MEAEKKKEENRRKKKRGGRVDGRFFFLRFLLFGICPY
jgi:hypothetical protein